MNTLSNNSYGFLLMSTNYKTHFMAIANKAKEQNTKHFPVGIVKHF